MHLWFLHQPLSSGLRLVQSVPMVVRACNVSGTLCTKRHMTPQRVAGVPCAMIDAMLTVCCDEWQLKIVAHSSTIQPCLYIRRVDHGRHYHVIIIIVSVCNTSYQMSWRWYSARFVQWRCSTIGLASELDMNIRPNPIHGQTLTDPIQFNPRWVTVFWPTSNPSWPLVAKILSITTQKSFRYSELMHDQQLRAVKSSSNLVMQQLTRTSNEKLQPRIYI